MFIELLLSDSSSSLICCFEIRLFLDPWLFLRYPCSLLPMISLLVGWSLKSRANAKEMTFVMSIRKPVTMRYDSTSSNSSSYMTSLQDPFTSAPAPEVKMKRSSLSQTPAHYLDCSMWMAKARNLESPSVTWEAWNFKQSWIGDMPRIFCCWQGHHFEQSAERA